MSRIGATIKEAVFIETSEVFSECVIQDVVVTEGATAMFTNCTIDHLIIRDNAKVKLKKCTINTLTSLDCVTPHCEETTIAEFVLNDDSAPMTITNTGFKIWVVNVLNRDIDNVNVLLETLKQESALFGMIKTNNGLVYI